MWNGSWTIRKWTSCNRLISQTIELLRENSTSTLIKIVSLWNIDIGIIKRLRVKNVIFGQRNKIPSPQPFSKAGQRAAVFGSRARAVVFGRKAWAGVFGRPHHHRENNKTYTRTYVYTTTVSYNQFQLLTTYVVFTQKHRSNMWIAISTRVICIYWKQQQSTKLGNVQ